MEVYRLNEELWFPDPSQAGESGFIAVGGDLSPERLLLAYSNGFFPWFDFKNSKEPEWYCPQQRYVIFPKEIHISHSMKQLIRKNRYEVTLNHDFGGVIGNCSTVNGRNSLEGAWLGPDIIEAYTRMYELGYAASIEVWEPQEDGGKRLVGGLYGIAMRNAFFGESMFSLVPNVSKLALIYLAGLLEEKGGRLIDCQFETPLFRSMGGRHIPYDEYMRILEAEE